GRRDDAADSRRLSRREDAVGPGQRRVDVRRRRSPRRRKRVVLPSQRQQHLSRARPLRPPRRCDRERHAPRGARAARRRFRARRLHPAVVRRRPDRRDDRRRRPLRQSDHRHRREQGSLRPCSPLRMARRRPPGAQLRRREGRPVPHRRLHRLHRAVGGERERGRALAACARRESIDHAEVKLRRFLAPLFAALAILVALLFLVAWLPLRQARDAWRAGHDADAIDTAERWSRLRLWPARYHQLLAAAYLTAGNRAAAAPHLHAMGHASLIDEEAVARRLFARERYDDFLAYDAAARDDRAALYRAAALAAMNRTAEEMAVPIHDADPKKLAYLKRAIAQPERLFDRNDQPLGADFAPLAASMPRGTSIVETTLDPVVQRAARQALASYRGAIVAIDPRTNELLAIASSAKENLAIERQY